ncbi:programmed cell death protein 2 [Leucosporidium creatinivorum]|uniref:Programmed cell death protein 2 n=1 Tax=Leucosporidium creatinivorum TaxID=106004 RepID=A0A1Y2ERD9_9BASI|nr:programmed cell death protein 2 [Leucosporidium creatinivorum]
MPPPSTQYTSRAGNANYDLATLSDDEDAGSNASQSTWSSSSNPDATVLGYSDGLMPKATPELKDWKVSRIGGDPVFPPLATPPSPSSSLCASCSQRMPLLTQIYCPLDSSALERVVYVFACPSKACRGKAGCVRAWRASQLWVEEEQEEEEKVVEEEKKDQANVQLGSLIFGGPAAGGGGGAANPFAPASSSSNPFATPSAANANNAFAPSSSNPFAPAVANPFAPASPSPFASAAPSPPPPSAPKPSTPPAPPKSEQPEPLTWPTLSTSYTPHWLTTAYEPSAPSSSSSKSKSAAAAMAALSLSSSSSPLDDPPSKHKEGKGAGGRTKKGSGGGAGRAGGGGGSGEEAGWGKEGYEVQQVKGVDEVFLRFQERVDRDGLQVVRYHHASPPLPYSSLSTPYRTLFPSPPSDPSAPGLYTPSRIPSCLNCSLPSTFEYQLMPNLVALLNRDSAKRDKGGEGKNVMEQDGLDFATVWVFACVGECVGESDEAWREERVLVEWEEE